MAKMFYTLDETAKELKCTTGTVMLLIKGGRLREFRDGSRMMFKADQVDNLPKILHLP